MVSVKCEVCGKSEIIWDMTKTSTGYVHPACWNEMPTPPNGAPRRKTTHDETAADAVETAAAVHARGFDGPEDGSQRRYNKRNAERPWVTHRFWWLVHNAVSHPLIALVPLKPMFDFHDWTSRKMHGK